MERDIIIEMAKLLENAGVENVANLPSIDEGNADALENIFMTIKSLNARYDKSDALTQVQWLMDRYNIQIDELMERIG